MSDTKERELVFLIKDTAKKLNEYVGQATEHLLIVNLEVSVQWNRAGQQSPAVDVKITKVL